METQARLLILDDDETVGVLIETIGRLAGLATRRTTHHEAFYAVLDEWAPSHIVIDLTMPGMSGEEVLRGLAARRCTHRRQQRRRARTPGGCGGDGACRRAGAGRYAAEAVFADDVARFADPRLTGPQARSNPSIGDVITFLTPRSRRTAG
ncbi:MAG: hypothetical protein ABI671_12705 [Burkholderiales bacterium]